MNSNKAVTFKLLLASVNNIYSLRWVTLVNLLMMVVHSFYVPLCEIAKLN